MCLLPHLKKLGLLGLAWLCIQTAQAAPTFSATVSGTIARQSIDVVFGIDTPDKNTSGSYFLAALLNDNLFLRDTAGWSLYSGNSLPSFRTGNLIDQTVPLVQDADLACLKTATVFAGYGADGATMLSKQNYGAVFSLKNPLYAGLMYARDRAVAYTPENQTGTALVGTVSSAHCAEPVGSDGKFSVSRVLAGNDAYPQFKFQAAGYQTTWTTLVQPGGSDTSQSIGLYTEQTVKPRPGFVKGAFTMDVGGFMPDTYTQGLFEPTYDRLVKEVGTNLIAISDPVYITAYDAVQGTVTMSKLESPGANYGMLNREQYTRLVNAAHARGQSFMMQLGVYPTHTLQLPWNVDVSNTRFWNAYFDAYQTIVAEYAGIARDLHIEYLSLGMNHGFMSQLPVEYWQKLISAIRATGYQGKLVYQAFTNLDARGGEFLVFNGGCCDNDPARVAKRLAFVKQFDALVLDVNNVALGRSTPASVSRDELQASFKWLLGQVKDYPVPVFVMMATPSVYGGAVHPEYIEPCLVCNSVAPDRRRDFQQQADAYQALAEVVNETPIGAGNVMGILTWGYWFSDDYLKWQPSTGPAFEMAYDKSANVRGKPAEAVLKWWFDRW